MAYIFGFLFFWTVVSVWYFVANLGNKSGGSDPWYIWVLVAPVLSIAWIMGFNNRRKFKKRGGELL